MATSAKGFAAQTFAGIDVAPQSDEAEAPFVLTRGAVLTGSVLAPDGSGLGGVRVIPERGASTVSANDGRYLIAGLSIGTQRIVASHADYGRLVQEVDVDASGRTLDLRFPDGLAIRGRVVDEDGRGVAEADVGLFNVSTGSAKRHTATSEPSGFFGFPHVPFGSYQMLTRRDGYRDSEQSIRVTETPIDGLEVILARGATISGLVRGLEAEELARVEVAAWKDEEFSRPGWVEPDGTYEISGLGPGRWTVKATLSVPSREASGEVGILSEDSRVSLDLSFDSGFTVRGTVLFADTPLDRARLVLTQGQGGLRRRSGTDFEGAFRFENVLPGSWRLTITHLRERLVHNENITVTQDLEVTVSIVAVRLVGKVVLASSGAPVADALVQLQQQLAPGDEASLFTIGSDEDGTFAFPRLPVGTYRVRVDKPGYVAMERIVDVPGGSGTLDLQVTVEPE